MNSTKQSVRNAVQMVAHPSVKNAFNLWHGLPGHKSIDRYVMDHKWAYQLGFTVSTVYTAFCGGCGGALWTTYYGYQTTGSVNDGAKAGAKAWAASYVMSSDGTGAHAPWYEKAVVSGVQGGIGSRIQGGSFDDGFRSAAWSSTASSIYTESIATQSTVPGGCGSKCEGVSPDWAPGYGPTPKGDGVALMDPRANNFGPKDLTSLWHEGSAFSTIMDNIPGMNAVANLHDAWNPADSYAGLRSIYFVGSAFVAAPVAYAGLLHGVPMVELTVDRTH